MRAGPALGWVSVAPAAPYFVLDDGTPWHPIGHNDAIAWTDLGPLFRRRDIGAIDRYLAGLAERGVTVLRLMLDYAQGRHRYFERPVGCFVPDMVRLWDDLFGLCENHGLRVLLTPFDTFWMWLRFHHHPHNRANGGPLETPARALLDPDMRAAIKNRLSFATARWGGSGALFAWDLWNEIHPAQAEDSAEVFEAFISDLSSHLRAEELRLHGRAHPQTVSLFGPELVWKAHLGMEGAILRHPALDVATLHLYEHGTIDDPADTVAPAVAVGRLVRAALDEIPDRRPFFDSEHGPIHSFKDRRITLPEAFDDEYFRHMQWAHLASGGAGGGMRWPNRHPHRLTAGMREAQAALATCLPHIAWLGFDRRNLSHAVVVADAAGCPVPEARVARFACGDRHQALIYLLRADTLTADGRVDPGAHPLSLSLAVPSLTPGPYRVTVCDTVTGAVIRQDHLDLVAGAAIHLPPLRTDYAVAVVGLATDPTGRAGRGRP